MPSILSLTGAGSAGAPVVIPPPALTGLVAWYKTDSLALSDTQAVASWPDSSGNGNTITQGTGSKQPIFRTGVINGQNAVRFSAANDTCLINAAPTGMAGNLGFTFYAVVKTVTWPTWGMVVVTNPGVIEMRLTNSASVYGLLVGAASALVNTSEGAGPHAARILRARFLDSSNSLSLRVAPTENTTTDATALVQSQIALGARDNSDTLNNLDGDIAEVLIYNTDIPSQDKTTTEAYLTARYGLTP